MPKVPTIKTDRFTLRKVDLIKDKENIIKYISDPDVIKKLTLDYPYTEESWQDFITWTKAMDEDKNLSTNWMIYIDDECVGSITLMRDKKKAFKHKAEVGYWLAKKHWGKGIMTEVAKIAVDYAFNELKLEKLKLGFQDDNISSRRVAEKNGFVFEYKATKEKLVDDVYKDVIYYCRFRER